MEKKCEDCKWWVWQTTKGKRGGSCTNPNGCDK